MDEKLIHSGTPRHSGRYPWGSGDDPEQRNKSFLGYVSEMKKKGLSEVQIAEGLKMTTSQLRAKKSIAKAELKKEEYSQAVKLKNKGYSNVEIGRRLGKNESYVRDLINPLLKERASLNDTTANMIKDQIDKKGYLDVGVGVERHIGVSRNRLKTAIEMLKEEGYLVTYVPVEQLGTGKNTTVMTLSKPKTSEEIEVVKLKNQSLTTKEIAKQLGLKETEVVSLVKTAYRDVYSNKQNIKSISNYSEDGGRSFLGLEPIRSVSSNRIHIRYAEDGGTDKDGVIELRKGIDDISLGKAKYAQVRIGVDDTHFLKGMAMYSDDIPKGKDIVYNTNKSTGTPKEKVFKEMKDDPDNPFGASVRQKKYRDSKGKEHLSALNVVNEEGEWHDKWSKSLSSQMLSKQSTTLAKRQLDLTYKAKKEEFDEIMSLTNPVVRKKLLDDFSDGCDSAAVHLKAAALPRSSWHVLLPVPSMKETEIYAPNYRDGEKVVAIRYPHGGIFEIPELTVNNRQPVAKKLLGQAKDAVAIHPKVAEKLSGADFDGDAVLVIPNNKRDIKTAPSLKALVNFNPKEAYSGYDGMRTIDGGIYNEKEKKVDYRNKKPSSRNKGMQMGLISNLITDMTIKGAVEDEIARAVKHSMVVIDSEKHHLDYKRSYRENGIAALNLKYQNKPTGGATTLISKSSAETRVPHREEGKKVLDPKTGKTKRVYIDSTTGKKLYEYTNETYTDPKGKVHKRRVSSTKMAEIEDAHELSSGTPIESIYANHANKLKGLANQARKEYVVTPPIVQSKSAKDTYANEVKSLKAHLNIALKNAPLERNAMVLANAILADKRNKNPNMDASEIKKVKALALAEARTRVGAKKQRIPITDKEWEAIQAGAISTNTLLQILNNTDIDRVKQLATPRTTITLTPTKQAKVKLMLESGYTQAQIADHLGVSTSIISKFLQ